MLVKNNRSAVFNEQPPPRRSLHKNKNGCRNYILIQDILTSLKE